MKAGESKVVCKCPACPDGEVHLIKRAEFKYEFKCDNSGCQTNRKKW